jgi:hypothetical protein
MKVELLRQPFPILNICFSNIYTSDYTLLKQVVLFPDKEKEIASRKNTNSISHKPQKQSETILRKLPDHIAEFFQN